ncbi:hypothetical protein ACHAXT_011826 [Thalassiosira profunda]
MPSRLSVAAVAATAFSLTAPAAVAFAGLPWTLPLRSSALHYQEESASYPADRTGAPTNATQLSAADGEASDTSNDEIDVVGAGTLGDIMAGSGFRDDITQRPSPTTVVDGLVTKEGGELNSRFGCHFAPMERIALTANGNLQRIFSSYYDAPVHVHVDSCARRTKISSVNGDRPQWGFNRTGIDFDPATERPEVVHGDAIWDRVVHIQVHDRTICKATSIISVASPECIQLIEEGAVGLGQMFRHLNKLPTFSLLDAGRTKAEMGEFEGGMWRTYELQSDEMTCLIHEEFHRDAWSIA